MDHPQSEPGHLCHVADLAWASDTRLHHERELQQARQEAEEARQQQERTQSLLDLVLAAAPVGLAFFDRDLRLVRINAVMGAWLRAQPDHLVGKTAAEVLPAGAAEYATRYLRRVLETGQPIVGLELDSQPWTGPTDRPHHWLLDFYPICLAEGQLLGVGAVVLDITQRKHVEDELKCQKEAAETANRAKDEFLAVLSHELRTPLTPVLTTIGAMVEDPAYSGEAQTMLQMVRRNVEMEARLIDDLLDVTRITRGKLQLNMMQVDSRLAVGNAVETCLSDIHDKRIALVVEFEARRPYVWGDPARLQQVVWNLLKNAVKFTPLQGKITLHCENEPDDRLRIQVSDTGIGIEPDVLPRIFAAFEQGEPEVTRRFGGLGLGLTISRALVEAHGGTLAAASQGRGRGSTFTVTLPTIEGITPTEEMEAPPTAKPVRRTARILLVEDHADTLRAMKRLLQKAGYTIHTADSIASALEVVAHEELDLLISDIGLPDGSGLELLQEIRKDKPLKAIALSGYGMEEDIRKSKDAGFQAHLTKPIELHTLQALITQLVC